MSIHPLLRTTEESGLEARYLETLTTLERLHRLLLDLIKDEFERIGVLDVNPIQALLVFHIGTNEVTAGELKTRGYYQGSNVSYNLKKLVELGFMHQERCNVDRRSVRVRLTESGLELREQVCALFAKHTEVIERQATFDAQSLELTILGLKRLEKFWSDQIRYIY